MKARPDCLVYAIFARQRPTPIPVYVGSPTGSARASFRSNVDRFVPDDSKCQFEISPSTRRGAKSGGQSPPLPQPLFVRWQPPVSLSLSLSISLLSINPFTHELIYTVSPPSPTNSPTPCSPCGGGRGRSLSDMTGNRTTKDSGWDHVLGNNFDLRV